MICKQLYNYLWPFTWRLTMYEGGKLQFYWCKMTFKQQYICKIKFLSLTILSLGVCCTIHITVISWAKIKLLVWIVLWFWSALYFSLILVKMMIRYFSTPSLVSSIDNIYFHMGCQFVLLSPFEPCGLMVHKGLIALLIVTFIDIDWWFKKNEANFQLYARYFTESLKVFIVF